MISIKSILFILLIYVIISSIYFLVFGTYFKNKNKENFTSQSYNISKNESEVGCYIETLDIWHPKIKQLLKSQPIYNKCEKHLPFTFIENNVYLKFNQTVNSTFYNGSLRYCQLAVVLRKTIKRDEYELSNYINITDNTILKNNFVKIRCFHSNNNTESVYEYVHAVFANKIDKKLVNKNNKLNVMILVLDGVSSSSFKRSLKKTHEYLKAMKNFFLFEKHHVVGINTIENIIPMLTNHRANEIINQKSNNRIDKPFDDVNFIWKNYSGNGYLTYFSEEWRESAFNNLKFGFKKEPTDFYLRHYWLALYDSKSYAPTKLNSNSKPCYYDKLLHHLTLDWAKEFYSVYKSVDNSIFGILKMNEMSHDYLERLEWIDIDLLAFFKHLFQQEDFLKKTLVLFMGDHGHRQHRIRSTLVGRIEEKLPLFSMLVPELLNSSVLLDTLKSNTQSNIKLIRKNHRL